MHWAGASLRFQEHEFKVRTEYGDVAGANLLDWPIDLKEMEPYYDKAEYKIGVTRTHGIPGLQEIIILRYSMMELKNLVIKMFILEEWVLTVCLGMEEMLVFN